MHYIRRPTHHVFLAPENIIECLPKRLEVFRLEVGLAEGLYERIARVFGYRAGLSADVLLTRF